MPKVPAVGYTRRSTDKQEASIPDQTKAIQQYADDKGYQIVRWYSDDAISGDDTGNRTGFLQMLADAQQSRDFETILCWDRARFGRFDSIEAGFYIHPLRKAGICLATVLDGLIDWNESSGRIIAGVMQEGKHQQLLDLSANVVRGQLEAAQKGSWLGLPPYGYRIEGERKNKRLVVDDVGKVKVVQRIFREFVEEGRSMSDIAKRLHAEGFVPPGNGPIDPKTKKRRPWRYDSVRTILENPAYAGDYASGRFSYGKYHGIRGGKVAKVTGGRKSIKNPESQWIVRRDTHEAIIERDTFERAQVILAKGKTGRNRFTPETNPFALAGLLRCGKCGCPMWGDTVGSRHFYRCGNWQRNGDGACEGTKVREDVILEGVADHLENWLGLEGIEMAACYDGLKPEDLPEAFEQVRKLVSPPAKPKQDLRRLQQHGEQLRLKLTKARSNLVLLDAENIPGAQERIRELAEELAVVELELKQSTPPAERDVNAVALEVLNNLYSLANCCRALARPAGSERPKPGMLPKQKMPEAWGKAAELIQRQAVQRFFNHTSHIVCHTTKHGAGTGTRHTFDKGEIVFKGVGVATGKVNLRNRVS